MVNISKIIFIISKFVIVHLTFNIIMYIAFNL